MASILINSIPGTPEGEVVPAVHSAKKVTIVAPEHIEKEKTTTGEGAETLATHIAIASTSREGSLSPAAALEELREPEDELDEEAEEEEEGAEEDGEDHENDAEDELEEAYFWHDQILGELQRVCRDSDPRGAYAILDTLSTDKLGRTSYTARAERTGEVVIVKTTMLEEPIERFAGKRLITELFLVRDMLAHPNVVGFYDLYLVETSEVWLVTEYMKEGVPLGDVIANTKSEFTEERMARICLEACKGLAHLHSQLIIHRDMRSDSIIIDPKGRVKITGFAFSVQLADKAAKRRTMVSTLAIPNRPAYTVDKTHWTAPEIIKRKEYGPEIDVWAFGITLFEMLEGGPPYKDEEPLKVLFLILVNGTPELKDAERLSEELKDFLSDCLTVDTEQRPGMDELVEHAFLKKACPPADLAPLLEMKPKLEDDPAVDTAEPQTEPVSETQPEVVDSTVKSEADTVPTSVDSSTVPADTSPPIDAPSPLPATASVAAEPTPSSETSEPTPSSEAVVDPSPPAATLDPTTTTAPPTAGDSVVPVPSAEVVVG
ncbi:kinase-like domain-containing protein [Mycena alexandri]|uniref:Kinase-like domain-containing protein n=1 Tax=Mycena alexandri TaxID=1745969 RepID=A0AAD6XBM5_9AGAR|nr:kinase-like domain-containing protein [Mycena alexandri]